MNTETKTITTPSGIEVVLKCGLNGGEVRKISNLQISLGITADNNGRTSMKGIDPNDLSKYQDAIIEAVVVSAKDKDGAEIPLSSFTEKLLTYSSKDYAKVLIACSEVVADKEFEEKKI